MKTHLINKDVSDEAFTEVVIFYGVTLIQSLRIQLTSLHTNPEINNNLKSLFEYLKNSGEVEKKYYKKLFRLLI